MKLWFVSWMGGWGECVTALSTVIAIIWFRKGYIGHHHPSSSQSLALSASEWFWWWRWKKRSVVIFYLCSLLCRVPNRTKIVWQSEQQPTTQNAQCLDTERGELLRFHGCCHRTAPSHQKYKNPTFFHTRTVKWVHEYCRQLSHQKVPVVCGARFHNWWYGRVCVLIFSALEFA